MDRRIVEQRLEEFVRDNRFTIAVVFPLVGAILLVASAENVLPPILRFNPLLLLFGIAVMRLPLITGVLPLLNRRNSVYLIGVILFVYGIEFVGITTGWPYGDFSYGISLGPMIYEIPLALPLLFLPLVINAYVFTLHALRSRSRSVFTRVIVVVSIIMAIDLVLDPGAVELGFWAYHAGGEYYDVPVTNYLGWVLSGTISALAIDRMLPRRRVLERLEECEFFLDDFISFIILWGAINVIYGNWIPVGIAVVLGTGLVYSGSYELPSLRERVDCASTQAEQF